MKLLLIPMLVIYIVACVLLIYVVLRQEGKGGGISGMLGGGSALGDALGAHGGEQFYRRWTRNIAIIFLLFSIGLTIVKKKSMQDDTSVLDQMPAQSQPAATAPGQNMQMGPTQPGEQTVIPGGEIGTDEEQIPVPIPRSENEATPSEEQQPMEMPDIESDAAPPEETAPIDSDE